MKGDGRSNGSHVGAQPSAARSKITAAERNEALQQAFDANPTLTVKDLALLFDRSKRWCRERLSLTRNQGSARDGSNTKS